MPALTRASLRRARSAGAGERRAAGIRPSVVPRRPPDARLFRQRAAQLRRRRSCSTASPIGRRRRYRARPGSALVEADEPQVTGFVFKVQANMDPNHRDRIAFVRLCSGQFRRGMKLFHVRDGKMMTVASPILFFAQQRETADEAFAGDIIGAAKSRHLARRRYADGKGDAEVRGYSELRARAVAPCRDRRRDEGETAQSRSRRSRRGRRGAGVPPADRFAHRSLASSASCSSTCSQAVCARSIACRSATSRPRAMRPAG